MEEDATGAEQEIDDQFGRGEEARHELCAPLLRGVGDMWRVCEVGQDSDEARAADCIVRFSCCLEAARLNVSSAAIECGLCIGAFARP